MTEYKELSIKAIEDHRKELNHASDLLQSLIEDNEEFQSMMENAGLYSDDALNFLDLVSQYCARI